MSDWTLDPLQLAPVALVAVLYAVRVRRLEGRVPRWRVALFATGIALVLAALASPVDHLAEERFFSFHMVQHLLLGDLAPLALLGGLTRPILRPVLALPIVERLRALAHPAVALPLWAANLYLWHLPFLYEGAVRHDAVHALEHLSFFAAGVVVWLPVLETLPAPEWFGSGAKLAYIAAVRAVSTVLANVFIWASSPFYGGVYREDALRDQGIAGGIMMLEGSLVTVAALAWLFLRMAEEGEVRQRLLERGLDPRAVRRAVRYRRWRELEGRP